MTKSQYLDMCEQTNQEIDWEKCPPEWEDFPEFILDYMSLYNSLGDRMYPDIGYIGKDFTNFEFLRKQYCIEKHQESFLLDIILWLDSRQIEISQKRLKSEYDKIKNKK